jgi:hypothetical protein
MADPSLFQAYMNNRGLKTPAFVYDAESGFKPSEQTQKVVDLLNQASGKKFNLQPANSVMAVEGTPMWGTGAGVVYGETSGTGYVDPLRGTTHTVAHEGAHSVFPSQLKKLEAAQAFQPGRVAPFAIMNPLSVPRETGQRLRYVHEAFGKPALVEESHAQGVADAVLNKLGLPVEQSVPEYKTSLDYPSTFVSKGIDMYTHNEFGPLSPAERKEIKTIFGASGPLMERVYKQGYSVIR